VDAGVQRARPCAYRWRLRALTACCARPQEEERNEQLEKKDAQEQAGAARVHCLSAGRADTGHTDRKGRRGEAKAARCGKRNAVRLSRCRRAEDVKFRVFIDDFPQSADRR
jgi:hypothetical protein